MKQSQVYSEVYAVLSALSDDYLKKIPKDVLNKINKRRDQNYQFYVEKNKPLEKQNLSKEAIAMLAVLKLDYWCKTQEEKEELELLLKANNKNVKLSSNLKKVLFKNSK